tara:strand:+ start:461 stop:1465 length:1005 start_codon:yes stop_codon:yes gene_type:complete
MIALYGTVVEKDGTLLGQIIIENGLIKAFHREAVGFVGHMISFSGYSGSKRSPEFIIFPGFIDLNFKHTERLAALSGGITSSTQYGIHIDMDDYNDNQLDDIIGGNKNILSGMVFNNLARSSSDPQCEVEGVKTVIAKIKTHNINSRIVISTVASLRLIQEAKMDGLNVWSEVHPINLYFDMVTSSLQTNPPLRSQEDRHNLLCEMVKGNIDILSSGHVSYLLSEKKSGVPELDTFGSLVAWMITEGVSPEIIFRMTCFNPSEWMKTCFKVGRIKEGYQANITVVAFNKPAIDGRQLYTNCGWSPYDLRYLKGSVEMVMLDGEKVVNRQWIISD